jgi:tetratricopeptide (TPR) repeat protein
MSLKSIYTFCSVLLLLAVIAVSAAAQTTTLRFPRPSQKASVMQTIGVTDVTITYHRPAVKGRRIWGDPLPEQANVKGEATLDNQNLRPKDAAIVPWGHVWRAGANDATVFEVTDDVLINGEKLPAGKYSLHTIPTKDEWTIIFNTDYGQWGSFNYDPTKDKLRVKTKPEWVADHQELLDYSIPTENANSAQVVLRWEKVKVPFTVVVPNVEAVWRAKADAAIAANPTDWRLPLSVASQYGSDKKWDEAIAWADKSIKVQETWENLRGKANILFNAGRKEEAFKVAELAIAKGKADKKDTTAFEKRVADFRSGKM